MYKTDSMGFIVKSDSGGYSSIELICDDLVNNVMGDQIEYKDLKVTEKIIRLGSLVTYLEGSKGNLDLEDQKYIDELLVKIGDKLGVLNTGMVGVLYGEDLSGYSLYMTKYRVSHDKYVVLFVEAKSEKQARYLTTVEVVKLDKILNSRELGDFDYVYNRCKCFIDEVSEPLRCEGAKVLNIEGSNVRGSDNVYLLEGDEMIDKTFEELNGTHFAIY